MRRQNIGRQGSARGIVGRIGRKAVIILAAVFVLQVVAASSPIPDWIMEWLSHDGMKLEHQPRFVVVLGHDIPSQTGLISAYYAAEVGHNQAGITYIVGMPTDDDPDSSAPGRIRAELVLRGIPASDILFESRGRDTHQQALFIRKMLGDNELDQPLIVVTSPPHVRRAVLCFRKQGFSQVMGLAAKDALCEVDLGRWVFLRYTLWCRLEWEPTIVRELIALAMYRLRGWI
jgi:uncharacterized SAM-binding protein YcdF (DUF218 family)